ncbi:MAG: DUF4276 family protein [Calditrichaeota bacterium]|nr:DUF4276 family protein [Calditrichota bacterium]
MYITLYVEGSYVSGNKASQISCKQAFEALFRKIGLKSPKFICVAGGGRDEVWNDFILALEENRQGIFIAMLIDTDAPLNKYPNIWQFTGHQQPTNSNDDQLLLMVTSMESWIAADRESLREFYKTCLKEDRLPILSNIENIDCLPYLEDATTGCSKDKYEKGANSFKVLSNLNPFNIKKHSDSFRRACEILTVQIAK